MSAIGRPEATPSRPDTNIGRRLWTWISGGQFWLGLIGFTGFLAAWYLATNWIPLAMFQRLPGPGEVFSEWLDPDPWYGISIFTAEYYLHIGYSTYRAFTAFALACLLGIPLGIMMGWKRHVRDSAGALLAILRPIPPLAWVPLAILMFPTNEAAVIFVTFLVGFFAVTLNTWLGVRSIHPDFFRAARCLGASERDILRDVILPGAMPTIFTGLQIAMGTAWFSLAAGEMIGAQHGLGYLVWSSYNLIQYPTIVIGMATLGLLGYLSSAAIRALGTRMMQWRAEALGAAGKS
jgi:NitT/TauT family transport system permease protein